MKKLNPEIDPRLWEMPECIGLNRSVPRATLIPFKTDKQALKGARERSPWFESLNGQWMFKWFQSPEEALENGLKPGRDCIDVPSNWCLQGFDKPWYTNIHMPFKTLPPNVPAENPTGLYSRTFDVSKHWKNRRTVIHFGGVESAFYLYVNGTFAGFSKDSRTPAEFDISSLLKTGKNRLDVLVIRWSDGTFMEDQDHWFMAGIYRDVYFYSTDSVYIEDVFCKSGYDEKSGTGSLDAEISLNHSIEVEKGWCAEAMLYDLQDRPVLKKTLSAEFPFLNNGYVRHDPPRRVFLTAKLPRIKPWSAESPVLYRLVVTLISPAGKTVEVVSLRTGFRTVHVADGKLLVNGQAPMIRGVNRHDWSPVHGKAISREEMLQDVLIMKRHNINAVRCSHYPNDPFWYDLCDEYGLYLFDEANIETHAYFTVLCDEKQWAAAFVDRVQRMVERDKNHPSIIAWSLGNESGYGPNHDAAAGWVRGRDPARPLHYQGGMHSSVNWEIWQGCERVTDMICPMYPSFEALEDWAKHSSEKRRPFIACEYAHSMGNAGGSLDKYWHFFEQNERFQGGFIWDWIDQGILRTDDRGRKYWAYGGDFDEPIHDTNFCCNGLLNPDREPKAGLKEYMHLIQPVDVSAVDLNDGVFDIHNKQYFLSLRDFKGSWTLSVDGQIVRKGVLPVLRTAPGESARVQVDLPDCFDGEAVLRFSFALRQASRWAPARHEVAWTEFVLSQSKQQIPSLSTEGLVEGQSTSSDLYQLTGGNTKMVVDCEGAALKAVKFGRQPMLLSAPELHVWRAPTDNDGISGWTGQENKPVGRWRLLGLNHLKREAAKILECSATEGLGRFNVEEIYGTPEHPSSFCVQQFWTLDGQGAVELELTVDVDGAITDLPRLGLQFRLPKSFCNVMWYGRGPHESYPDRKDGAGLGLYQRSVKEMWFPYVMPQENGNRTDTRWLMLSKKNGSGLRIEGASPFQFSVSRYSDEAVTAAAHIHEQEPEDCLYLNLDLFQRGLGNEACGPSVCPEFQLSGPVSLSERFVFKMID